MTTSDKHRVYPTCCTSAFCGKTECPSDCPYLPVLSEFKAWKEANRAVVKDRIWSPLIYTSTAGEETA